MGAQPWFPEDPAPGPWFRDETRPQPPGPAAQEPLTLSEPVWVTDFFRNRPPEAAAEQFRPAYPARRPPGWAGKAIALAAAVVLLSGGIITWRLARGQPAPISGAQPPGGGTAGSVPASAVPSTAASTPPATSAPGRRGRGRNAVALAPELMHTPEADHVAAFLETYFRAINQRDYAGYASLLGPSLRPTVRQFRGGYRSTSDSGAVLTSLSAGPHGLAAAVTFISHQDPALSPDHSACTKWGIILYLRQRGTTYLIVPPPHGYHAAHQPCV